MTIEVKLKGTRSKFLIHTTMEEWHTAFHEALERGTIIEVNLPDQSIKTLDPRSVFSWKEIEENKQ